MSGGSGAWPVLWLSTNAVQCVFRQVFSVRCFPSSAFRQVFSVKCFPSNVFREVFPVKCFSSIVFLRGVRHFQDSGVFRQQGNSMCLFFYVATEALHTHYAFDKKTPNFAQGLDFSRFLKEKQKKTEDNRRKHLGIGLDFLL